MSNNNERLACVWGKCNGTTPPGGGACNRCGTVSRTSRTEPPPGSWADVARMMASMPTEEGEPPVDWDRWKDEMKETNGEGY